jgi:hypothetical protein
MLNSDVQKFIGAAQAGMKHAHKEFNCEKIAGYMLDCVEKGSYKAPWTV